MIKTLSTYISTSTSLVLGTDIFIGSSPYNKRSKHVIIRESGGSADFYYTDTRSRNIQVLSFGKDYIEAKTMAERIHAVLHGIINRDLSGVDEESDIMIAVSLTISTPAYMGINDENLHVFSSNYVMTTQYTEIANPYLIRTNIVVI